MSGFQEDDLVECPICLDELDLTDRSFKPCKCGYQMCRFCWNHIIENLNGRCPACRQPYKTENYKFTPPNPEEIQRVQNAKKARVRERKHAEANARKNLTNVRVIQRNLVYLTNLALSAATEEILKKPEYFGKFGRIKKIVVNRNNVYQGPQGSSVSAYITYYDNKDAHAAIKAVDGTLLEGRLLRASFGTTKYCSNFLRNVRCPNPDCMYLHSLGNDGDSFTKEDMAQGKHLLSNITLNPEDPNAQKLHHRRNLTQSLSSVGRPKPNAAWKTVPEIPVSVISPQTSSLNPEEWPDTLSTTKQSSQPKKRKNLSPSQLGGNHPTTEPAVEVEPLVVPPKSALPATASWGSRMNEEEDIQRERTPKSSTVHPPPASAKVQPGGKNPPVKASTVTANGTTTQGKRNEHQTKKTSKMKKSTSVVTNNGTYDSDTESSGEGYMEGDGTKNGTSEKKNIVEQEYYEDEYYDDGIDNATYDEKMSRLSLSDVPSLSSDSMRSDNESEEAASSTQDSNPTLEQSHPAPPETAGRTSVVLAQSSNSLQNPNKQALPQVTVSQPQNVDFSFTTAEVQIFEDWLRLRFTDLLLDNSNDCTIPEPLAQASSINSPPFVSPLFWNSPFMFFDSSPTTKSRFDFARNDDPQDVFYSNSSTTEQTQFDTNTHPHTLQQTQTHGYSHTHVVHPHNHVHSHTQVPFKLHY